MLQLSDDILFQEMGEELVLLNLRTEQYYNLDEVGARLLTLLRKEQSLDKVVGLMMDEYDVEEAQLRSDIDKLISSLSQAGLIS